MPPGRTFGLLAEYHSPDYSTPLDSTSKHLDDPDRIHVEILWRCGHDGQRSFGDQRR